MLLKQREGRVAEKKSAARPFIRRQKEHAADRLRKNKGQGEKKYSKADAGVNSCIKCGNDSVVWSLSGYFLRDTGLEAAVFPLNPQFSGQRQ